MDSSSFEELIRKVAPRITHKDIILQDAIPPGERLTVTLRYLTTGQLNVTYLYVHVLEGETFESLKFLYKISAQSTGKIILDTVR